MLKRMFFLLVGGAFCITTNSVIADDIHDVAQDLYQKGEYNKAFDILKKASDSGDNLAKFKVGLCLLKGEGVACNATQAVVLFEECSGDNAQAQFWLAICYQRGLGVKADAEKALGYLKSSAKDGYVNAQTYLGKALLDGSLGEENSDLAVDFLRQAAIQGSADAAYNLGEVYWEGIGRLPRRDEAIKFFKQADELGDIRATVRLGDCYNTKDVPMYNIKTAIQYYEKAIAKNSAPAMVRLYDIYVAQGENSNIVSLLEKASEMGDIEADAKLGVFYLATNETKALEYLQKAAKQGSKMADYELYEYYIGKQDSDKAIAALKVASDRGNIDAKRTLGYMYYTGDGIEQNKQLGYELINEAANNVDAQAQYLLAAILSQSKNKAELQLAFENARAAAGAGYNPAEFLYGMMLLNGVGCLPDHENALIFMKKAAEGGNLKAKVILADYYVNSNDNQKITEAITMLTDAGKGGDGYAHYLLGRVYAEGIGGVIDYDKGFTAFNEAVKLGENRAYHNLAFYYKHGLAGVPVDTKKMYECFAKGAEAGNIDSYSRLALCYLQGTGVEQNPAKAVEYLKKAMEKDDPVAIFWMGFCYLKGLGVNADATKAFDYFKWSADLGYSSGDFFLSMLLKDGIGCKADPEQASVRLRRAADAGNADAMYNLAQTYYCSTDNSKRDQDMAIKLYEKAAELGSVQAIYTMGCFALEGIIVEKNPEKGFAWVSVAAEKNYDVALLMLGRCYELGNGTRVNYAKAKEYYKRAADVGFVIAQDFLKRLENEEKSM